MSSDIHSGLRLCRRAVSTAAVLIACGAGAQLLSGSANAACFEQIGCTNDQYFDTNQLRTLSCDALWTVRNFMYDEHGYCFQTAKAQAVFSNEGCSITNGALIPFNAYERGNVDRIVAVEREKAC